MTTIQTSLDLLVEPFRAQIRGLLAEAMERRVYFVVTETNRTYERQKVLFDEAKSRTMRSNHLIGRAVDIAPVVNFSDGIVHELTWSKTHPAWKALGDLAEKWGVEWGGRWTSFPDYPHLEAR